MGFELIGILGIDVGVYYCTDCGAVVVGSMLQRHVEFHNDISALLYKELGP